MKDSTLIYASTWEAIKLLPTTEKRYTAIELLVNYGLFDIKPETDDPEVKMIVIMALPAMNAASLRYEKAVENGSLGKEYGKSGGRPEKVSNDELLDLKDKGYTQKQISEKLEIDERTVRRRLSELHAGQNRTEPLNDNV